MSPRRYATIPRSVCAGTPPITPVDCPTSTNQLPTAPPATIQIAAMASNSTTPITSASRSRQPKIGTPRDSVGTETARREARLALLIISSAIGAAPANGDRDDGEGDGSGRSPVRDAGGLTEGRGRSTGAPDGVSAASRMREGGARG